MASDADPSMTWGAESEEGVTETQMSPMGACSGPLDDECDLCLQEKRQCDGGGLGPCSSCVSERRAVCHYSESTLPDQEPPPRRSSRTRKAPAGRSHGRARDAGAEKNESHRRGQLGEVGGGGAAGASGSSEIASSQVALKRSRLSASPATGLIGLPENGFLDDFFGSLGFMPLASECVVRDAMVSVMFAEVLSSEPLLLPSSTRGVGEDDEMTDTNGQAEEGHWCKAVVGGGSALPRNSSTCLLWCAIALGALVRGSPLAHVRRYVDLAEDSLEEACSGSATVEIVRAHIAMALLHDFLGDKEKNHDHLQLANSAMDAVPAEEVPKDLLELRDYAGMAWNSEGAPISAGRVSLSNFCSDNASFRKLPDIFGEEDLRSFFIRVDSRSRTSLLGAAEVSIFRLCPSHAAARSAERRREEASRERPGRRGESDGGGGGGGGRRRGEEGREEERGGGGSAGSSSGASSAEDFPPERAPPDMLPEMLRLKAYVDSSAMRSGVGALMFYRILATLQAMNNDPAGTIDSFWRTLDVKVRYPGLCRLNDWFHTTHAQLWSLASGPYRERYEELRAAYNPVRPEGSPAAPPYDRWKGISDVCDDPDAFCRGLESPGSFRLTTDVVENKGVVPGPSS